MRFAAGARAAARVIVAAAAGSADQTDRADDQNDTRAIAEFDGKLRGLLRIHELSKGPREGRVILIVKLILKFIASLSRPEALRQ